MISRKCAIVFVIFILAFFAVTAVGPAKIETADRKDPVPVDHKRFFESEYNNWTVEPVEPVEPVIDDYSDKDDWDLEEADDGEEDTGEPRPLTTVYPLQASSIYTYRQMVDKLHSLRDSYPDLIRLGSIGSSVEGRTLWSLSLGKGEKKVLVVGSCHAREWLTTPLLVRTIETYALEYSRGGSVDGFPVRPVLDQYTLVFVPMQNPDGVNLAQFGLSAVSPERHEHLLAMKPSRSDNFTLWKANIRGVDLNRQHSAGPNGWSMYKYQDPATPKAPWYKDFPGTGVESEPESKALAALINNGSFELVLTYHSSGEIFFWYYFQDEYSAANMARDVNIVNAMAAYSGYRVHPREALHNRVRNFGAHLTAWVVHDKKIPCITVEIGKFTTGYLNMNDLPGIWTRTRALPLVAVKNLPAYQTSFNVTCSASPPEGGTVNGGGVYEYGVEVVLSAEPSPGYSFVNWTENGAENKEVSKEAIYIYVVTGDRGLTANFAPIEYAIAIEAAPSEYGAVKGGGAYRSGSTATLRALPHDGYCFVNWTENGAVVSDSAVYSFTVTGARNLVANFAPDVPAGENGGNGNEGEES